MSPISVGFLSQASNLPSAEFVQVKKVIGGLQTGEICERKYTMN
jgi:hypothetical protein